MLNIREIFRKIEKRRSSRAPSIGSSEPVFVPPLAGVNVNEHTALQYSAIYACVRIISETVASLPWRLMRRRDDGGADVDDRNNLHWLLYQSPNKETSAWDFRRTLEAHRQTWGNGYAEIVRDNAGRPQSLWIITPDRVTPSRSSDGGISYLIDNGAVEPIRMPAQDIFHLRGLGFDGVVGYSPIALARQAIGLGIATEQFGATWFGNGSHGSGILQSPTPLAPDRSEALAKQFERRNRGPKNGNRVLVLEGGMEYKPLSVPPDDAQWLSTRAFQVTEVARWYRVPPTKLGDLSRATWANVESQSIEFVTDAIVPAVNGWESEAQRKLIGTPARRTLFTKMSVQALMRGDQAARSDYYERMWRMGVLSPNEIRRLEDLNPIEDGDQHLVQMNLTTLDDLGEETEGSDQNASQFEREESDEARRFGAIMLEPLTEALDRCVRKETRAMAQAHERNKLAARALGFYEIFAEEISDAVVPVLRAAAKCMRGDEYGPRDDSIVEALADEFAGNHIRQSAGELDEARKSGGDVPGLLELWKLERATMGAQTLLDELNTIMGVPTNAVTD